MREKTPVPIGEVTSFRHELARRPRIPAQTRLLERVDRGLVERADDFHALQRRRVLELEYPSDLSHGIKLWSLWRTDNTLREIPGLREALNASGESAKKAAALQEETGQKPFSIDIVRMQRRSRYGREPYYTSMPSYAIEYEGGIVVFKGVLGGIAHLMDSDRVIHADDIKRELRIKEHGPLILVLRARLKKTGVQLLADNTNPQPGRGYFWEVPPGVKMNAGTTEEWDTNSKSSAGAIEPSQEINIIATAEEPAGTVFPIPPLSLSDLTGTEGITVDVTVESGSGKRAKPIEKNAKTPGRPRKSRGKETAISTEVTPEEVQERIRAIAELLEPCRLNLGATLAGLRSILSPRLMKALNYTAVASFIEQGYIPQPDSRGRFSPEAVATLLCLVSSWEDERNLEESQQSELHDSVQTIMAKKKRAEKQRAFASTYTDLRTAPPGESIFEADSEPNRADTKKDSNKSQKEKWAIPAEFMDARNPDLTDTQQRRVIELNNTQGFTVQDLLTDSEFIGKMTPDEQEKWRKVISHSENFGHVLIAANYGLLVETAKKFAKQALAKEASFGALLHAGARGIQYAMGKFDPNYRIIQIQDDEPKKSPASFITYAKYWIQHYMQRELGEANGIGRNLYAAVNDALYLILAFDMAVGRRPRLEEMREQFVFNSYPPMDFLTRNRVMSFFAKHYTEYFETALALDFPLKTKADPETLHDILPPPSEEFNEEHASLYASLTRLSVDQQRVVRARFGINPEGKGYSIKEIATMLDMDEVRVTQLLQDSLALFRENPELASFKKERPSAHDESVDLEAPIILTLANVSAAESLSRLLEGSLSERDQKYLAIKLRYLALMSNIQIGEELGIPTTKITSQVHIIKDAENLPLRAELRKQQIAKLIIGGSTPHEIAGIINKGRVYVNEIMRDLEKAGKIKPQESIIQIWAKRDKQVAALHMRDYSRQEIQDELGISEAMLNDSIGRLYASGVLKRTEELDARERMTTPSENVAAVQIWKDENPKTNFFIFGSIKTNEKTEEVSHA